MTEQMMVNSFIEYLESQGLHDYATELGVLGNSSIVDLVHIDKRRRMVCIEFKLKAINIVFQQAIKLRRHNSLVYIAIPQPHRRNKKFKNRYKLNEKRIEEYNEIAKKYDIGIWFLTPDGDWIIEREPELCRKGHFEKEGMFFNFGSNAEHMLYVHLNFTFLCGVRDFYKSECKPFIFEEASCQ